MIYNGRDFSDFGVHVDESKAFGSPEKDYELIEVVGRNGNLSIYNDRFKDIVLSFPCFIRSGFIEKYRNLLAYLNSLDGYQRLETEKEPNHFRKALFTGSVDVQTTPWNQGGFFTINFSALPQRFLKTGENWTTVSSSSSSVSGNPVTISNPSGLTALTGLSVDIQPVQDLNGYDHPWVGGAGKNLFDKDAEPVSRTGCTTEATDTGITVTATATGSNKYARYELLLSLLGKTVTISADISTSSTNISALRLYFTTDSGGNVGTPILNISGTGEQSATATIADTLPEGATKIMLFCYAVSTGITGIGLSTTYDDLQVEIGSIATEWSPYENICPITGHTSAAVQRSGKNLLPNLIGIRSSTQLNLGTSSTSIVYEVALKAGTYTLSVGFLNNVHYGAYIKEENSSQQITLWTITDSTTSTSFTLSEDGNYRIWLYRSSGVSADNVDWFQLELSDTPTAYESYTTTSYPISLGRTVYGGTLDVLTGVLTVTHGYVDLGSLAWSVQTSGGKTYFRTSKQIADMKPSTGNNVVQPLHCSHYIADTWTHGVAVGYDFIISEGWANRSYIGVADSRYTSVDDFETAMNGVQLVYELAEPTTVQLTAQQVSLLTGTNIISTDMANLTVTLSNPAELENPTLFESKPLIRVYGNGTLNVNNQYITVANSPYTYIDIDCELMDCYHGSNNANQYVSFSTTDYVTLRSGMNYFSYSGFTKVEVTPRWFEI